MSVLSSTPLRYPGKKEQKNNKERTKRGYIRTAKQVVEACLEEIAPNDSDMLFHSLYESSESDSAVDSALLKALAECYNNAQHRSIRRQVLSIMADQVTFKQLKHFIPSLTRYRYNIARHHLLLHDKGAVPQAHVATASRIGDHCRTYALSCPIDSSFESSCDHEHDLHCERCDLFPSVLQEILAVLREKPQSEEIEELS